MIPPSFGLRLPAFALVAALALVACTPSHTTAATVGDDTITTAELDASIPLFRFLSSLSQQACGQPQAGEPAGAACARFTLTNLIQEDLADAYAKAHDVPVATDEAGELLMQLTRQLGGPEQLEKRLSTEGLAVEDLRSFTERLLVIRDVQSAVAGERVSNGQLRQAYRQQQAQFAQLHAAHILVSSRREAGKIASEATPRNFARLAQKYSTDTGSAKEGGDLGVQPASQLDQGFVQAALSLKPDEISGPVQTQFGWHVIMLISSKVTPFDKAMPQLVDQLSGQAFQAWLQESAKSAGVDVNPLYGRFDGATVQVVPITSTATGAPANTSVPPGP